jgi:tripartite-type tricarboxylate transporter receptor subunit TctC
MSIEFKEILRKIAEENNTTPEEVYTEMKAAIDMAFASEDPAVIETWRREGFEDRSPDPEEFVRIIAGKVAKETIMN